MGAIGSWGAAASRWLGRAQSDVPCAPGFVDSFLVTIFAQVLTLVGLFVITRISIQVFGAIGFGEYQVARRTLAMVAYPLMCGLGISLPRYIARDFSQPESVSSWLAAAILLAIILASSYLALAPSLSSAIGRWTFGPNNDQKLVSALLIAAGGMFATNLATATVRGLSRFRFAAFLQVLTVALVPLGAIMLSERRVDRALEITGSIWIAIAVFVLAAIYVRLAHPRLRGPKIRSSLAALFIYGAPRVPGELALFGLFALPGYAAVQRGDVVGAGFVSVGLSLIQAIATAFASTGFVLLPYWSRLAISTDGRAAARRRMGTIIFACTAVALLGVMVFEAVLPPIARLLLGPLAQSGIRDLRRVLLGSVPYVVYLMLRDYFDAIAVIPLNTLALSFAVAIEAVLLAIPRLSISSVSTYSFLALGTIMLMLWIMSGRFQNHRNLLTDRSERLVQ